MSYLEIRGMDAPRALWSAPAKRSGDGALATGQPLAARAKAVSRYACHRTPKSLAPSHEPSAIVRAPQYFGPLISVVRTLTALCGTRTVGS